MLRDPKGNTSSGGGGIFRTLYPLDKELVLGMVPPSCLQPQARVPSAVRAGDALTPGAGEQLRPPQTQTREKALNP